MCGDGGSGKEKGGAGQDGQPEPHQGPRETELVASSLHACSVGDGAVRTTQAFISKTPPTI